MNNIVTKGSDKYALVSLFFNDGKLDVDATKARLAEILAEYQAVSSTDFDTMKLDFSKTFTSPATVALRNLPESEIGRLIWNGKIRRGEVSEDPTEEKAQFDRFEEVLGAYLRAHPDQFLVGKGSGVLIRYVDGDFEPGKDEVTYDAQGNEIPPTPRQRWTAVEWAAKRAAHDAAQEKAATKAAAKAAAKVGK